MTIAGQLATLLTVGDQDQYSSRKGIRGIGYMGDFQ